MALSRIERRQRIKSRIRKVVKGTAEQPRLAVFRSNNEIYVQIIDDTKGTTLLAASSRDKEISAAKAIAEKALKQGIEKVSFDRGGYLYHGRVKSLADGAREGGLKF